MNLLSSLSGQLHIKDWSFDKVVFQSHTKNLVGFGHYQQGATMDKYGLIWLTTPDGIMTFDGDRYSLRPEFQTDELKFYTLNSRHLEFDFKGRLWIMGHDRGLIVYDFKKHEYVLVNSSKTADLKLTHNACGDIYFDKENITWLITNDFKLHQINIDDRIVQTYNAWPVVNEVYPNAEYSRSGGVVDYGGCLWIASSYGIIKFDKQSKEFQLIQYYEEKLNSQPLVATGHGIYINKNDLIVSPNIIDYSGFEVLDLNTEKWKKKVYIKSEERLDNLLRTYTTWNDSTVLVGARRSGFILINLNDYSFERITESELGLDRRDLAEIWKVYKISDRLTYFISQKQIIVAKSYSNPFEYNPIKFGEVKSNWQRGFYHEKTTSRFFIGSHFGDGLLYVDWDDKSMQNFPYKSKEGYENRDVTIESIIEDSDTNLILGTSEGILKFDRELQKIVKAPLFVKFNTEFPLCQIHELFSFSSDVWISTKFDGLFKFDTLGKKLNKIKFAVSDLEHSGFSVIDVKEVYNNIYFCTTPFGLRKCIINSTESEYALEPFEELKDHPISNIELSYSLKVHDTLWLGSDGYGLFKLVLDKGGIANIFNYQNAENAKYNQIGKIIPDDDGIHLWLNTGDGFSKFNTHSTQFNNFGIKEGIGFPGRNGKFFYKIKDGTILAGAHMGFHHFHPDSLLTDLLPVKPYLESFSIEAKHYPINSYSEDTLYLEKGTRSIEFDIRAINNNENALNYFSYKLVNYDEEWSKPNLDGSAHFTKIPGGEYTFYYKAANKNLEWTHGGAVTVYVQKTLFEYSVFWFLLGVLILALAYLFYKNRMARIRKELEIKQEFNQKIYELEMNALRLQMNPHFVFNSINSINWFIIKNDKDNASNYLAKFSRLIRLILENSKSKLIPLSNELDAIELYLEMESLRFEQKFEYNIELRSHVNSMNLLIPPMIIQPYIENSIWHGLMNKEGVGHIDLKVYLEDNKLVCVVEDNGIGREAANRINQLKKIKKQSLGLKITDDRLKFIEKVYGIETDTKIIDLYNEEGKATGTRVIIEIPQMKNVELET